MKELYLICGMPGSGKSTIARGLKNRYGDNSELITVDDEYMMFLEGKYHYMCNADTRNNIEYHYNRCNKDIHNEFFGHISSKITNSYKDIIIVEGRQLGEIINTLNELFLHGHNITNILATKEGYLYMKGIRLNRDLDAANHVL